MTEGRRTMQPDIPLDPLDANLGMDTNVSLFDQISYGFVSIGGFIYQNSYIFTNILMMTWSIVYHSWLTFVLLLWANVLWMIPNQRKAMMRSSPFIVIYAELLLLAQYIYGMNLTNDELPSKVDTAGINLSQIGLERPQEHGVQPCVPLMLKTLFLLMFWVTLRQFFKEKREAGGVKASVLADIIAPLQITLESSMTVFSGRDDKRKSKFLKKIGSVIKNLLVRLWIWLLVLVIFLCAVTGKTMTGFRICYMALFLFFLLVFQSSSKAWVKVMYGFWLFLIFYAMSILILIYTYQFDKFDQYWNDYLSISKTLQSDIGLEQYQTKDLFLHLASPTAIVILTVIQVHYFHRRFIASLQDPVVPEASHAARPTQSIRISEGTSLKQGSQSNIPDINDVRQLIRQTFKRIISHTRRILRQMKNIFWRFLELHIMKAVYITAFVCAVSQVCLLHIIFVALCLLGIVSRLSVQTFVSRIISFIVTIIILAKMIYQITYLDHSHYDVHCDNSNVTSNIAIWFGLQKASLLTGGLIGLLKLYIVYMVIVTMHAVVGLRQYQMRLRVPHAPGMDQKVLFPNTVRADAEKNLRGMIKYLFNYGFYKFGWEVSLIALVAAITYRQDIVAVAYAAWLIPLFTLHRRKCSRVWPIFVAFIGLSIFFQYLLLLGMPPTMCIVYPWLSSPYSVAVQQWLMLPGDANYDHTPKLIFDFILLLIIDRQRRVYYIEAKYRHGEPYPGGSNKNVVKDIATLGQVPFHNPTRDFLSHIRNYLDIFKNVVLCGFFWVTLGVTFIAGTAISDILALGYLAGAFVFLWQGSEFYLRPIRTIIRSWQALIYYNMGSIVLKTCLQFAGCIFMDTLKTNCCWLVHLLGISCTVRPELVKDDDAFLDCPSTTTQTVLLWDAICFGFLIMQLRIFKSHYFCHIIIDTKANSVLASRGAEIIEDLRQKQIRHQQNHEMEVLFKIKRKMEKIRATQQRILKPADKQTHLDEHSSLHSRAYKRKVIRTHPQAVRAGDYYMFDDMDEKFELDIIEGQVDFLRDHEEITESEKRITRRKTVVDSEQAKSEKAAKAEKAERESKPSTSREATATEEDDTDAPKKKEDTDAESPVEPQDSSTSLEANPIVRLLEGFLVSLAIRLNRFSRNYRYVNKILAEEKKALKDVKNIHRLGRGGAASMLHVLKRNFDENNDWDSDDDQHEDASREQDENTLNTDISPPPTQTTQTPQENINSTNVDTLIDTVTGTNDDLTLQTPSQDQQQQQQLEPQDPHVIDIIELPIDTVDGNETSASERILEEDDFESRDHHILVEVAIATYFAILSNTDLICYIVVFANQVVNASIISLPLPIMVFLWGTLSLPRPTKTFWVTLIAYTQAIVFIKCIFQFKLIWANYINLPNQPLAPAKILGIEMNPNYASYDLMLLLVLFFHRFILKSQGLWKSDYQEEIMKEEEELLKSEELSRPSRDGRESPSNAVITGEPVPSGSKNALVPRDTPRSAHSEHSLSGSSDSEQRETYASSIKKFFYNLVHRPRLPSDVYALMFLCDFTNFFVLLFGFTAFGSQQTEGDSAGGVQTYLAENKVPIPFLIMLLVQFILIVIDRALYLRKALVKKIIFHFLSVIGIHIWMFFVVPAVTERSFYSLAPPVIFYIIKCFYMLLSSYQIKCGYPKRILGNFLTKGFSLINMIAFKIYMLIPFLYELRTILDWVCIDSTMTVFDWLKMEDIFSDIYLVKCTRQMETDFPAMRAQKKTMFTKLLMGGNIILLIVIAIWGPLCLFALGNAVGQPNIPYEVSLSIRIGQHDPIYQTSNRETIYTFDESMYESMRNTYSKDKGAITFLTGYDAEDIATLKLPANSPSLWSISPPDKEKLLRDLKNENIPITTRFRYTLTRVPPAKGLIGTVGAEVTSLLDEETRIAMVNMLELKADAQAVTLMDMMPKFIKVLNSGEMTVVNQLMPKNETYRPLIIEMNEAPSGGVWWKIRDYCEDEFYRNTLDKLPMAVCDGGIVIYTFNDKKFPSTFSFLTAGGIIGLYTTFVLLASRVLKSFISGQNRKIMFEDLPYVDRVLQLCLDIYLVREALEFALEEDLFAKLIFLYRSPETMIKWTRPKEEVADDDTESGSTRSHHRTRPENQ